MCAVQLARRQKRLVKRKKVREEWCEGMVGGGIFCTGVARDFIERGCIAE